MSTRSRLIALFIAPLAFLAATAAPVQAQEETSTYYLGAEALTLELNVLGTELGAFAGTSAIAQHLPAVNADAFGVRTPAATLAPSSAKAEGPGQSSRDPQGDGVVCETLGSLLDLPIPEGINLADVCSTSYASLSAGSAPDGGSAADAGILTVNGRVLVDLIYDLLLAPLLEALNAVTGPIDDAVVGPVDAALAQVCDGLPPELNPIQVVDAAESLGLPVDQAIATLPQGDGVADTLGNDCLIALNTMVQLRGILVTIVEEDLKALLLEVLDRDLLNFSLGSAQSSVITSNGMSVARAELAAAAVQTPSLQFLLDAIEELLAGTVQGVIDDVTALVPESLGAVTSEIPTLGDVLTPILDGLDTTGLIDDEPLLTVAAAKSVADARQAVGSRDVDTSQSSSGAVLLKISSAIANTLGIPNEITVAPGTTETFAEGTPLESSITVGGIESLNEVMGNGVDATGVKATATEIHLLKGIEGGIRLTTGAATARVGGNVTVNDVVTTLPTTGGESALLLAGFLGLLSLAVLRMRRRSEI